MLTAEQIKEYEAQKAAEAALTGNPTVLVGRDATTEVDAFVGDDIGQPSKNKLWQPEESTCIMDVMVCKQTGDPSKLKFQLWLRGKWSHLWPSAALRGDEADWLGPQGQSIIQQGKIIKSRPVPMTDQDAMNHYDGSDPNDAAALRNWRQAIKSKAVRWIIIE